MYHRGQGNPGQYEAQTGGKHQRDQAGQAHELEEISEEGALRLLGAPDLEHTGQLTLE